MIVFWLLIAVWIISAFMAYGLSNGYFTTAYGYDRRYNWFFLLYAIGLGPMAFGGFVIFLTFLAKKRDYVGKFSLEF